MIPLLESLPEAVTVDGRDYPIVTDYRDWMRFELMLRDDEISNDLKLFEMLKWYDDTPPPLDKALVGLIWFFRCGANERERKSASGGTPSSRIYDYEQDAGLIYSSFRACYGIDLIECEYLHWWRFRALLENIPEDSRLARVMAIRGADIKSMKGEERKRYAKLKEIHSLSKKTSLPQTVEERDAAILERERAKAARAMRERKDR